MHWCSKKGGETRFCIDYRDCNSKLLYLDSPIPLTVEALDKLSSGTGEMARPQLACTRGARLGWGVSKLTFIVAACGVCPKLRNVE